MKYSVAVILSIILSINLMTITVYAENTPNVSSIDIGGRFSNFSDAQAMIISFLDEINLNSTGNIEGKISLLEPFYMPEYSPNNNCFYQETVKNHTMFTPIVCNDKVIGVFSYAQIGNDIIPLGLNYLSENSENDLENGLIFFKVVNQIVPYGTYYGGVDDDNIFVIDRDNSLCFSMYKTKRINASLEDKISLQNNRAILIKHPTYDQLSCYYYIDSSSKVIYSFDYKYSGDKKIISGSQYYLQNKYGKYLSYSDGKYTLSDHQSNSFILTEKKNGAYTISPETKPKSRMSVNKTSSFSLNLSYYDGYCYQICKSDNPDSMMTANGNSVIFSSDSPDKVNVSLKDWYIIKA